jgi:HD-GYP domain-containing protein (c-di-GMP phosphodiesterase class II)
MDRDVVSALARVVELKDSSTAAHTWRVGLYTQALGEAAGLPRVEVERAMEAAVLHDIGKIDIPANILTKPGRLTPDEFEVMKTHAVLGYDRLVRMGETDPVILALVRSHHERLDGTGYPDSLKGDEIPIAARSFAVIDSFDAMTSIRSYRKAVGKDAARRAIAELRQQAGIRYCAEAVELFAQLYASGSLDWILHHLNDAEGQLELPSAPDSAQLAAAKQITIETGRFAMHVDSAAKA